jgi:hypothetical protein
VAKQITLELGSYESHRANRPPPKPEKVVFHLLMEDARQCVSSVPTVNDLIHLIEVDGGIGGCVC